MTRSLKKDSDRLLKFVLIGDSGVGKSSLLLRFTEDVFPESYTSTIGVDFLHRKVEMNGEKVCIQVWDTAGQERYRTITTAYYNGAHGIIVVYDVSSRESFEHVEFWLTEIAHRASPGTRAVPEDEAKSFAEKLKLPYWETSAKYDEGVEMMFVSLAQKAISKISASSNQPIDKEVGLYPQHDKKYPCCQ